MNTTILFVTGEYPPMHGGVGDYTARLCEAIEAEGWTPLVLTSREAKSEPPRIQAEVERWNWRLPRATRRTIAKVGAGVVHIQYQTGAFGMHPAINLLPWTLRRDDHPATVTTFHDLRRPYLFPKAGFLRPLANRLLASGSDAVVVTNPEDRRRLERIHGLGPKLHQIPIGSNLPDEPDGDRAKALARLGIRPTERVVGFFGFPTQDKGIDLLLDALTDFGQGVPRLVMVGGDVADTDRSNREYAGTLYRRVQQLRPAPVITGHLEEGDAAAALSAVDVIVLPFRQGASLRNGSLLAALASGRPVITTTPGRAEDLLPFRDRESLLLLPPADAVELQRMIRDVLDGAVDGQLLSERAQANLATHRWQSIAKRHIDLYASLLGEPPDQSARSELPAQPERVQDHHGLGFRHPSTSGGDKAAPSPPEVERSLSLTPMHAFSGTIDPSTPSLRDFARDDVGSGKRARNDISIPPVHE